MKKQGVVIYLGNSMRVQNRYGGWEPVSYECDYDPNSKKSIDVRLKQ